MALRGRRVRIEGEGPLPAAAGENLVLAGHRSAAVIQPLDPQVPRFDVRRGGVAQAGLLALGEPDLHLGRQPEGDLVLHREDIVDAAVVALRPQVSAARRIDQLGGNSDAVADFADAALEHVADAELARDVADVDRTPLVDEARVARDDGEAGELRQRGEDVVDQSVGKELLLRIAAHHRERQYGDRRLVDAGDRTGWRSQQSRRGAAVPAPHTQWPVDVLEPHLTGVDERDPDLAVHLRVHDVGRQDAAVRRLALQTGGDVDAIAQDVVAVDDDVPQVDADAELEPPLGPRVALGQGVLQRDGALDGVDGAAELDQCAIAHRLDDAPVARRDGWIERLAPDLAERSDRTSLVDSHHAAVADDVRSEDGGQSSRDLLFGHWVLRSRRCAANCNERRVGAKGRPHLAHQFASKGRPRRATICVYGGRRAVAAGVGIGGG